MPTESHPEDFGLKNHSLEGASDAVERNVIRPHIAAPVNERETRRKSPSYFPKHLTCRMCSAKVLLVSGMLICTECDYQEGCCN